MDNVIIFGAGASADAGIPMLRNFMSTMIDIAQRGTFSGEPLSQNDRNIFAGVFEIRSTLDSFLARTNINQDNIEDVLSILTFDEISGEPDSTKKSELFAKAIARTIELTCNVRHNGDLRAISDISQSSYSNFWKGLFSLKNLGKSPPVMITLNYDLVFERALLSSIIGNNDIKFKAINFKYRHSKAKDFFYLLHRGTFDMGSRRQSGVFLEEGRIAGSEQEILEINYLKLHGSLNFSDLCDQSFTIPCEVPAISPPIFDKTSNFQNEECWRFALQAIRSAKNVIFVGYSLPKTDIYMEYFLKAGLGPNRNLREIHIFDPAGSDLQNRFKGFLSSTAADKLHFNSGRFSSFSSAVAKQPSSVFFL